LPASHLADAEQEGFLTLLRAADRYDEARDASADGSGFQRLLARTIDHDFFTFRKRLRRQGRLTRPFGDLARTLGALGGVAPALRAAPGRTDADPHGVAEQQELARLLPQIVAEQPEDDRRLCEALSAGLHLTEAAGQLGISYATAKRRRDELRG